MTFYSLIRPALFRLDAEQAHGLAIAGLKYLPRRANRESGALATTVAGIDFPNPVGMAAGFDKDAEVPDALLGQGFGFAEVGSITPLPQSGNPRPRLFRLVEDGAVINRMGFNNGGAASAVERLAARRGRPGVVGINIGASLNPSDKLRIGASYRQGPKFDISYSRLDDLDVVAAEGEQAFARMQFSGTHSGPFLGHAPTGKRVSWQGAALFTFRGGRIAELWVLGDLAALEAQLRENALS